MTTFQPGSRAILHIAPGKLACYQGQECEVISVQEQWGQTYANVLLGGIKGQDVPISYLRPAEPAPVKRRSPLTLKPDKDTRSEAQKQSEAVAWLKQRGYTVLVTGAFVKKMACEKCGHWQFPHTGFGNSPGVPDLLISHTRWGKRVFSPLEFKRDEKSDRKPEQVALVDAGLSVFVWSLPMALQSVYEVEVSMGVEPLPELVEWLQRHNLLTDAEALK